ncbi:copper-resistant cuproprotein CopI [Pseudomonas nitroreducens]|uniref:copper-resistant cuproprotein CopI n=1 Tax=Pseudomonas nitroreducens TaxID=46680 RepID=UPI002657F5E6|nr:cupredoxin family protein [Pseudomonas nitroreducens]MCP1647770.1 putative cupredoxin-like copper-binding protein [Pseudomonas nitroreducens]MCP1686346.1 putative cupredoxin-like copper-binding protein [Pseudomonas nitroreducens]
MSPRHLFQAAVISLASVISLPALADAGHAYEFGKPAKAAQATRTVEIKLGEMFFEPESIDVKPGETVRFVIHNGGSLLHEFNLGSAAMHAGHQKEMQQMMDAGMLTPTGMQHDMSQMDHSKMGHGQMMKHDDPNSVLVEPGKTAELTWTFSKATSLEFACNIPGHYQAGMVGKLTVKP